MANDILETAGFENRDQHCKRSYGEWTDKEKSLLNWFQRRAAPLAAIYEAAVHLIYDLEFPGRIHFIAHAVREIGNRLVYVLDPQSPKRRLEYPNRMDDVSSDWPKSNLFEESSSATPLDQITVPRNVAIKVDTLVRDHRESRSHPSSYELLFRFLAKESSSAETSSQQVKKFKELHDWFMKFAHISEHETPNVDEVELRNRFFLFEGILFSFVGDFFAGVKEIDEILQQANQ